MRTWFTPRLVSRRGFGALAAGGVAVALRPCAAAKAGPAPLTTTPRQTTGPFYPVDWSGDVDGDLVRVMGEAAEALGTVTHLRGRVLDQGGEPIAGAVIEIWQCDGAGRYRHPRDRQDGRDPGFQGHGRVLAAADGSFAFRTIKPVAYPGRTPHIHVAVVAPGRREPLVTQFYVAGESRNQSDRLFNSLRDPQQRESVLLHLEPAEWIEPRSLIAVRDIVLG